MKLKRYNNLINMSQDCIFCKIVSGQIPTYTLFEDEKVIVVLDAYPVSFGHALFIPKKHYKTIDDVPEEEIDFLKKLPNIVKRIREITNATGINIWQNNGKDAGQTIPHVHFHIVPRYTNDNLFEFPAQKQLEENEARDIVEKFKQSDV